MVKIWFIIQLKQLFINGCFRFQGEIKETLEWKIENQKIEIKHKTTIFHEKKRTTQQIANAILLIEELQVAGMYVKMRKISAHETHKKLHLWEKKIYCAAMATKPSQWYEPWNPGLILIFPDPNNGFFYWL